MGSGDCLTDEQLRQTVESVCSREQQTRYEEHVGHCADCQRRLADFSGEMPPHVTQSEPPSLSPSLSDMMEQLRGLNPSAKDATTDSQTVALFSYLDPPQREGSLGRLGKYEVLSLLGRGGMGEVFVAFDPLLSREVAIKVPSRSVLETPQAHDRFVREARALAAVEHDNIVTVHSAEVTGEVLLLVMERVDGESLAERLAAEQKLPWTEVLAIGKQVAAALEAAHGVGVVHRDITPGNLLLEAKTRRVKVSDFGLARPEQDGAITSSSMLVGTPEYMSPEQATEARVGASSDLYSLGTVLYEACSGQPPFRAKTVLSTLRRVTEECPSALHERDRSIPVWFSNLIARLMSKDPSDRPASAADLLDMFENEGRETKRSEADVESTGSSARHFWLLAILVVCLFAGAVPLSCHFITSRDSPAADGSPSDPGMRLEADRATSGFFVASVGETFAGLDEALAAADDGDAIEVRGSGPFPFDGVSLGSKRMTIRAARGAKPVFVSAADTRRPFVKTTADLKLEGIAIRWATVQRPNTLPQRADACVISVSDANVSISGCRVVSESGAGCLGCQGGSMELADSLFQAGSNSNVLWIPGDDCQFSATHCVFESQRPSLVVSRVAPRRDAASARILLQNNTISSSAVFQLMMDAPLRPMQVQSRQNIFDAVTILRIAATPRIFRPIDPQSVHQQRVFLRLGWTEYQNAYRRDVHFVKRGRAGDTRPRQIIQSTFDGWLTMIGGHDSGSFQTDFIPNPQEQSSDQDPLPNISVLPPNAPADVGADLDRVGPTRRRPVKSGTGAGGL